MHPVSESRPERRRTRPREAGLTPPVGGERGEVMDMRPDDALACHACSVPTYVVVRGPTELGESRDFVLVNAKLSPRSQLAEGEEAWSATLGRDRDGELVAVPAGPGERLVRRSHRKSCEALLADERAEGFPGLPQIAALVRAG